MTRMHLVLLSCILAPVAVAQQPDDATAGRGAPEAAGPLAPEAAEGAAPGPAEGVAPDAAKGVAPMPVEGVAPGAAEDVAPEAAERALPEAIRGAPGAFFAVPDGDPGDETGGHAVARALIALYGCPACHLVPGMPGFDGVTGPPLDTMPRQVYVAGVLPNTPEALARFIADPQAVDPRSAMPDLGVTRAEAATIAAFLLDPAKGDAR